MNDPKAATGQAKSQLQLIPPALNRETAAALACGAVKYGPWNWRFNQVEIMTYLGAIRRHLDALLDGEDTDPESSAHHLGHIAAGCAIVLDAARHQTLIDNRPPRHQPKAMNANTPNDYEFSDAVEELNSTSAKQIQQLERELAEYKESHATALREREATEKEVDAMLIRALKAERSLAEERAQHAEDIEARTKAGKAFFASHTQDTTRLEAELAKASRLQQAVTIASLTIKGQSATIERLTNADLRADRARLERDAIASDLDNLRADINALMSETDAEREANHADRHIAFAKRMLAFLAKHQIPIKPRHSHEDAPGRDARPERGTQ